MPGLARTPGGMTGFLVPGSTPFMTKIEYAKILTGYNYLFDFMK